MYWFKTNLRVMAPLVLLALTAALPACHPDVKETKGTLAYFDIKGFFKADSARLSKLASITKTVTHNSIAETQKVHITNWRARI